MEHIISRQKATIKPHEAHVCRRSRRLHFHQQLHVVLVAIALSGHSLLGHEVFPFGGFVGLTSFGGEPPGKALESEGTTYNHTNRFWSGGAKGNRVPVNWESSQAGARKLWVDPSAFTTTLKRQQA